MTSRIVSKLALAAVLAGTVPAIAAACDGSPAPVVMERGEATRARRWREERRERELFAARAELRRLDAERAEYLGYHHGRGELRRYERWYSERRAELERRCRELEWVAWR